VVDVNYHVFIKVKANNKVDELRETHTMRYLFAPEVGLICSDTGLRVQECHAFMGNQSPGFDTWTAVFIAIKDE
jgi:hypothetical protein